VAGKGVNIGKVATFSCHQMWTSQEAEDELFWVRLKTKVANTKSMIQTGSDALNHGGFMEPQHIVLRVCVSTTKS
jgi:hypothetical protein